jgi:hypothetical protein
VHFALVQHSELEQEWARHGETPMGGINMKRRTPRTRSALNRTLISFAVASCFAVEVAYANPNNPAVAAGAASFNTVGSSLTVTNSPNAIINWRGFSIGAGELTRFQQQSASSAVLNRVVGQDPSGDPRHAVVQRQSVPHQPERHPVRAGFAHRCRGAGRFNAEHHATATSSAASSTSRLARSPTQSSTRARSAARAAATSISSRRTSPIAA